MHQSIETPTPQVPGIIGALTHFCSTICPLGVKQLTDFDFGSHPHMGKSSTGIQVSKDGRKHEKGKAWFSQATQVQAQAHTKESNFFPFLVFALMLEFACVM